MGSILSVVQGARSEHHTLNKKDFRFICELVYESTGIVLDERKREMVYRRLMRRIRELKIGSFTQYCSLLKANDKDELPKFINAITTNLTSFFREKHHFDYLKSEFLPSMMQYSRRKSDTDKRLRIWSSASSTGEEPYSIAMTLMSVMQSELPNWDARILATDLDSDVVHKARNGVYGEDRISELDAELKKRWFFKGSGENSGLVKVDPKLSELITFKQLNLLDEWPIKGPFDVIFCRNVLIYFDKETQNSLIPRFWELLRPGGLLFLGHSESILKETKLFESLGKTMYRKPG